MRLAFMGTPDFSVPTLNALYEAGHEIVAVYSQPARKAGRGQKMVDSAVAKRAKQLGLLVITPEKFRTDEILSDFEAMQLDAAVVVAYGQILPQRALDAPRLGCVNVHASLLPRWRGAAPIHRAIMAGDEKTGVGIMQMEAGLDTGTVLLEQDIEITPTNTTLDLHDSLAAMGADLINDALAGLDAGKITPRQQSSEGVTYAKKIEKSEAQIDWSWPAEKILNHVRGLFPFPGGWAELYCAEPNGDLAAKPVRVKILSAEIVPNSDDSHAAPAGTAVNDQLCFACGDGNLLRITKAQRPGKGGLPAQEFLRGLPVPAGSCFKLADSE